MAYFDQPNFGAAPERFGELACGGDSCCEECRRAQAGLGGFGCGGNCSCRSCAGCRDVSGRLGERYIADDDEEENAPPGAPPPPVERQPRARTPLPPTRMRSGLGTWGFAEAPGTAPLRVVFVPGIMGSKLAETRTGLFVWGDNRMLAALASPVTLAAWRVAMGATNGINDGRPLRPAGLTHMVGADPYSAILADLRAAIGAANVLEFPYDWRLANEHSAGLLRTAIRVRWPDVEASPDKRVTVIAHSMGGLVARWLIEQLGGARLVRQLITVGTPHIGAPEALTLLANVATSSFLIGGVPAVALASLVTLVRRFGSLAQLLPGNDFLVPRGGSIPEPITATFRRLRTDPFWTAVFGPVGGGRSLLRGPASVSIRHLNRTLIGSVPALNHTLAAARVRYVTLAEITHNTALHASEIAGPIVTTVKTPCGDGTVPAHSAVLPAGPAITPLFIRSTQAHSDLFRDPAVRRMCLAIVRGTVPGTPVSAPVCAAPAPRAGLEGHVCTGLGCPGCIAAAVAAAAG